MPGKKQKAKERLDKYYNLAKEMGYRSRAAFKLVQLNRKYDFLKKANTLVDLCAAPGSWSQVAVKAMPAGSTIIAVDLVKIAPIKGVKCLQGDITTDKTRSQIKQHLAKKQCEVVVHDGAPNVGGTYAKDAFNQNLLTLKACKLACEILQPGGWFVTKVFRSTDFYRLLWVMKQLFEKVEQFKPPASRQQSAEVFVVCAGYHAPKKLDPNMFSQNTVFVEMDDAQALDAGDPIAKAAAKGRTTEYPEGKMLLHTKATVQEFLASEDPKQFLNTYNQIIFEDTEEDRALQNHKLTNRDVIECFKDLKVISRWDQNNLIKWAKKINREKLDAEGDEKALAKEAEALEGTLDHWDDEKDEERLEAEIEALRKKDAKTLKRRQRKQLDKKLLQAERIGYNPEDYADDAQQTDFFEFSKVNSFAGKQLTEKDYDDNIDIAENTEIAGLDIHRRDEEGRDMVMDDADDEEDEEDDDEVAEDDDDDVEPTEMNPITGKEKTVTTTSDYYRSLERVLDNSFRHREDYESDETITEDEADVEHREERYLASSEEEGVDSSDDDSDDSDSIAKERMGKKLKLSNGEVAETKRNDDDEGGNAMTVQQQVRQEREETTKDKKKKKKKRQRGGFEEIPNAMLDPETRARTLAIAQQMLEGKKRKRDILEEGIHKWCTGDEDLPKWFLEDEQRHNIRPLPITKAEVEEQKQRFREINARPAKKVAEAVGRRRKRAADKLKRILVKEKNDPRMKGSSEGLTIRKIMRGKDLRWKKKVKPMDPKSKAEAKRQAKREKQKKGKGGGKKRR